VERALENEKISSEISNDRAIDGKTEGGFTKWIHARGGGIQKWFADTRSRPPME
jgi:hypothetical protein